MLSLPLTMGLEAIFTTVLGLDVKCWFSGSRTVLMLLDAGFEIRLPTRGKGEDGVC